jgi:hypothetical protein
MPKHTRSARSLFWLALASITIVVVDGRPVRSMEVPALMRLAGASTVARLEVDAGPDTLSALEPAPSFPIELVPAAGYPLSHAERDSLVRFALALVGVPYYYGGTSPDRGFDCSGFVGYVLSQIHLPVPRMAYQQARVGSAVERSQLQPGDLLAFGRDSISHIGIYIGDGKFVHASSVAKRVIVSRVDRASSQLVRPLRGARRLVIAATPGIPGV